MSAHLHTQPVKGFGPEPRVAHVSLAPNGTSDPLASGNHGPRGVRAFTTTYAATGQYTLVFHPDFAPPSTARFFLSPQCADLASYFEVVQLGAYNATTRTLVIQAKRAGAGYAVPAADGARIHIEISFNDSSGA